ncbi:MULTISPECIES: hypothetical protein [unclassified Microcoleus]
MQAQGTRFSDRLYERVLILAQENRNGDRGGF